MADQQAEVVADELGCDLITVLGDPDLSIDAHGRGDLVQHLLEARHRVAHRRRPDRFFFLRGGVGGGVAGRDRSAATLAGAWEPSTRSRSRAARPPPNGFGGSSVPEDGPRWPRLVPPLPPEPVPPAPPEPPPPPTVATAAGAGPIRRLMINCWPIV